jgi:hypothetical protein
MRFQEFLRHSDNLVGVEAELLLQLLKRCGSPKRVHTGRLQQLR